MGKRWLGFPPERVWPAVVTLSGSLILSMISIHFSPLINRDGMLYIRVAELITNGETEQALTLFNWPFLSFGLAALAKVLPVSLLGLAYAITLVFSALATWLLVLLLQRGSNEENIWWAVFFALCFTGFNEYRPSVLRDWPAWLFMLSAVWFFLNYLEKARWLDALLFFLSITLGAAFRLEAAAMVVPLSLLLLYKRGFRSAESWCFFAPPLLLMVGGLAVLASDGEGLGGRLGQYLSIINPLTIVEQFGVAASALAGAVLNEFSREFARPVLFFGLLSMIPVIVLRFLWLPLLLFAAERRHGKVVSGDFASVFFWLAVTWLLIDSIYLLRHFFLSSRYLVPLMMFMLPFLYGAFLGVKRRIDSRAVWYGLLFLLVMQALSANIATRGRDKLAIIESGAWLERHVPTDASVHINDGRVSFYAGRGYFSDEEVTAIDENSDWNVIYVDAEEEQDVLDRIENYRLVKRFHSADEVILVLSGGATK